MKRAVSILLMVVMMAMCMGVSAQSDVKVTLDVNEIFFPDAQPFIDERDRVLVPIRFVSEALGALVDWENESRTAVIKQGNDEIRYTVYQPMAYLNGEMMVIIKRILDKVKADYMLSQHEVENRDTLNMFTGLGDSLE